MPYCPNCGREVEETDRFCVECGENLEGKVGGGHSHAHTDHAPPGMVSPGRVGTAEFSTATLWGPLIIAGIGILQSLYFVLAPAQVITAAGFGPELTEGVVIATGVLGLLMSFSVLGLVYYYWDRGYVTRRYFWALVGLGIAGFFLGGGVAFVVLIAIGAYGLLSVL